MRDRLVFITNQLPYPPQSGGVIKSWRLLACLANRFDVELITPLKGNDALHVGQLQAVLPGVKIRATPVERPRTALNFLRSLVSAPTLNAYRTANKDLHAAAANAISRADLVLVDHLEAFPYVPRNTAIPVVLHQHNAEHVMWERARSVARNLPERLVLSVEALRVKRFEAAACRKADLVLAAPNDQEELVKLGIPRNKLRTTLHLGDDSGLEAPTLQYQEAADNLLYVGTLSWPANADGLHWFLAEVWPALRSAHPALTMDIVGRGADQRLAAAVEQAAGVAMHGFVEDLEPFYRKSKVFIAPLRFGSGTKVKVLTALYRGLPCVTTSFGTEGLDLVPGEEILVANNAAGTANHILALVSDRTMWESLRDASRRKSALAYSWNPLLESHVEDLLGLIGRRS